MTKKIIIRLPNWIGDFVMATPLLSALRDSFPQAEITVMCQAPLVPLIEQDPRIDEILSFSKQSLKFSHREGRKNVVAKLRQGSYDIAIAATNSFSSAWFFWQARIPVRIGFSAHFRSFLLTKRLPLPTTEEHLVDTYQRLLQPLLPDSKKYSPKLAVAPAAVAAVATALQNRGLKPHHKLITINAFAAYGPAKCWPLVKFQKLAQKLLEDPTVVVVFIGDKKSRDSIQTITKSLGQRGLNFAGLTTLAEMVALVKLSQLLITNDSGPMHIAAADTFFHPAIKPTRVVAIFGSTNPRKTGPYGSGSVITKQVACSPCYRRHCPIDFRCMHQISVEQVLHKVQQKERNCYV